MIRRIEKGEIPEIVELIKESFRGVSEEFGITRENAPNYVAFATTVEKITGQFEEGRPMFAFVGEDGKIVGYYSIGKIGEEECELNNLCVLPEFRHRKIGETLLMDCFEKAKEIGYKKVIAGIVEENQVLRKWYERNGMVHTGTKKFEFFPFTCGYLEKVLE